MINLIEKARNKIKRYKLDPAEYYSSLVNELDIKNLLHEGHNLGDLIVDPINKEFHSPFLEYEFRKASLKRAPNNGFWLTWSVEPHQLSSILIKKGQEKKFYTRLLTLYEKLDSMYQSSSPDDYKRLITFVKIQIFLYTFKEELERKVGKVTLTNFQYLRSYSTLYIPELDSVCHIQGSMPPSEETFTGNNNFFNIQLNDKEVEDVLDVLIEKDFYNKLTLSMYSSLEKRPSIIPKSLLLDKYFDKEELNLILYSLNEVKVNLTKGAVHRSSAFIIYQGSGYFIYQDSSRDRTIVETDLRLFMEKLAEAKGSELSYYEYHSRTNSFTIYC